MNIKKNLVLITILPTLLLFTSNSSLLAWHSSAAIPGKIIYSSTSPAKQKIGINNNTNKNFLFLIQQSFFLNNLNAYLNCNLNKEKSIFNKLIDF